MTGKPREPRGSSKFSDATRERAVRLVLVRVPTAFGNELECVRHVSAQLGVTVGDAASVGA